MARAAKATGSKSGVNECYRIHRGKPVMPVMYLGKMIGHGNYMAGTIDDKLVTDKTGRPIPYKFIEKDK